MSFKFWQCAKGQLMLTRPRWFYLGRVKKWGFSRSHYGHMVSFDTIRYYTILHVGPFEFFVRPVSGPVFN